MSDKRQSMNGVAAVQLDEFTPAERKMADKIVDVLLSDCSRVGYSGTASVLFTLLVQAIGGQMNDHLRLATVQQVTGELAGAVEYEHQRVKAKVDTHVTRLVTRLMN